MLLTVTSLKGEGLYRNSPPGTRGLWTLEDTSEAEAWVGGLSAAPRTAGRGDGDRALRSVSLQCSCPPGRVSLPNVHSFLGAPGHVFVKPRKFAPHRVLRDPIDRGGEG